MLRIWIGEMRLDCSVNRRCLLLDTMSFSCSCPLDLMQGVLWKPFSYFHSVLVPSIEFEDLMRILLKVIVNGFKHNCIFKLPGSVTRRKTFLKEEENIVFNACLRKFLILFCCCFHSALAIFTIFKNMLKIKEDICVSSPEK